MIAALALLIAVTVSAAAETFSFSADRLEANLAKGHERTVLAGHARLASEQYLIEAESIELYGEDFSLAVCRGGVRITDTKNDATYTCSELRYDRSERIIRLQGAAVMEDRKNEMVVKGELLESRDREGLVIVQIGVRILKKDLVARAQMARYFREEEVLELSGLPVVTWKGDTYRASRIRVDLKKDSIRLEGAVAGQLKYEEQKTEQTPEAASPEAKP